MELGLRIVRACDDIRIPCRLLGGVAIQYLTHDLAKKLPMLTREPKDIDLAAYRRDSRKIIDTLNHIGLIPDERFNALHGHERLKFYDPQGNTRIDFFLDIFRESHVIDLRGRLEIFSPTIPPSDLLLTKLQIWEINEKDIKDIILLLHKFEFSNKDSENTMDISRITKLTSDDWGLYKTVIINIERTQKHMSTMELPTDAKDAVINKLLDLRRAIEEAPKTMKWKMRAAIGERVKWYETPEEA